MTRSMHASATFLKLSKHFQVPAVINECAIQLRNTCTPTNMVVSMVTLLSMTVKTASKMHFNALRSQTQLCLTAYCI